MSVTVGLADRFGRRFEAYGSDDQAALVEQHL